MTGGLLARYGEGSIARTLTVVMSLTAAGIVTLACIAFVAFDALASREDLAKDIDAIGGVIGSNCAAAIVFDDRRAARDVLSALANDPHMVQAAVFSANGSPLATWARTADRPAPALARDGVRVDGKLVTLFRPIVLEGERVGTVYLATSIDQLYQRLTRFLLATVLVLAGATAAAFFLSARVQRRVSNPILELAAAARRVSSMRDYTTRVPVQAGGELGTLTRSFNEMLTQIEARDTALHDAHGELAAQLARLEDEVAERKRAEDALRASEEQFRQAQKMEAIGQLAGGVAHDFNNLLTAIRGYSELSLDHPAVDESLRENIEEVMQAADRASALTRQLLAFSRKQLLTPCILDAGEVVRGMEKMLRRLISADIDLLVAVAPHLGRVRADRGQLEQVVLNLAVNARDAMTSGGMLTIEVANARLEPEDVARIPGASPGPHIMLAVTDTGCGMDERTKARIFEPFFTTKEQGKGTGLGLSTVYGIVKQSGGSVCVFSEPGAGTSFKIYLAEVAAASDSPAHRSVGAAPRGSETILLVEDDAQVRRFTAALLRRQGYQVLEAALPAVALAVARDHPAAIHLLLTDMIMPKMNGRDVYEHVRAIRPDIRVVFMSGYTETGVVREGIVDEGVVFVQKPFSPAEIAQAIRDALDQLAPAGSVGDVG